jgi:hypothetical protein
LVSIVAAFPRREVPHFVPDEYITGHNKLSFQVQIFDRV